MPCTLSFVKYNLNLLCSFYFYLIKETGSFDPRTIILMPSFYFFLICTFNFQITVAFCDNCMLLVLKSTSKISQISYRATSITHCGTTLAWAPVFKGNLSKGTWVSSVMFLSPCSGMSSVTLKVKIPPFILSIPSVVWEVQTLPRQCESTFVVLQTWWTLLVLPEISGVPCSLPKAAFSTVIF